MLLYYCFALVSTKSILAELEGKYNYFLLKTSFIFVCIYSHAETVNKNRERRQQDNRTQVPC